MKCDFFLSRLMLEGIGANLWSGIETHGEPCCNENFSRINRRGKIIISDHKLTEIQTAMIMKRLKAADPTMVLGPSSPEIGQKYSRE